jgi:predicted secreted protein
MKSMTRGFAFTRQWVEKRPPSGWPAGPGRGAFSFIGRCLLVSVAFLLPVAAPAHEESDHYDRVHMSASAQTRVQNDIAIATLYAQEEGSDAAALANMVNTRINEAVELVRQHDAIRLQTSAYNTSPVYHKNKITGWRVRQSIRLESRDITLLSDLAGKLQQSLNLQEISFAVSPELKNSTDDQLIKEALQVFEQRAKSITQQLGRRNFKIVEINVGNSVDHYPRRHYEAALISPGKVAAPSIESGEQTLKITVSGQIEME